MKKEECKLCGKGDKLTKLKIEEETEGKRKLDHYTVCEDCNKAFLQAPKGSQERKKMIETIKGYKKF